jgi:hypothetical protein
MACQNQHDAVTSSIRPEVGDSRSDSNETVQRLAWAHRRHRP